MYSTRSVDSRRQFRQAELNDLISLAMGVLEANHMAWAVPTDTGHEAQVTARVSKSRIAREARNLLSRYPEALARKCMTHWIEQVVATELESYKRAQRQRSDFTSPGGRPSSKQRSRPVGADRDQEPQPL